jgi:hypothetical protein
MFFLFDGNVVCSCSLAGLCRTFLCGWVEFNILYPGEKVVASRRSPSPPRSTQKINTMSGNNNLLTQIQGAGKLNSSWICLLGGPEDDLLGRNMSP